MIKYQIDTGEKTYYNALNSVFPATKVIDIIIDSNGNKWIATTSEGLIKYDGTNFTIYNRANSNIHDNSLTSLAIDSNGVIWVGTKSSGLKI